MSDRDGSSYSSGYLEEEKVEASRAQADPGMISDWVGEAVDNTNAGTFENSSVHARTPTPILPPADIRASNPHRPATGASFTLPSRTVTAGVDPKWKMPGATTSSESYEATTGSDNLNPLARALQVPQSAQQPPGHQPAQYHQHVQQQYPPFQHQAHPGGYTAAQRAQFGQTQHAQAPHSQQVPYGQGQHQYAPYQLAPQPAYPPQVFPPPAFAPPPFGPPGYLQPGVSAPMNQLIHPAMPKPWLDLHAYEDLTGHGIPSSSAMTAYNPIRNFAAENRAAPHGVMRIENAPYDTMRNEVVSLLGRGARIIEYPPSSANYAIHVIFDRLSGKAFNTFVELESETEAERLVRSFEKYEADRKHARRLGNRPVKAFLSTEEEMMQAIFPKVRCVQWAGTNPVIRTPGRGESNFEGFLGEEELRSMVRLSEKPGRTQFGKESPQRVYEAMNTVLQKFPFHAQNLYSLKDRNMLFAYVRLLVCQLVVQLQKQIQDSTFVTKLTCQLLTELVHTACASGGFSSQQHTRLVADSVQFLTVRVELHPLAAAVPFEALSIAYNRAQGIQAALVEWYVTCIRKATGLRGALRAEVFNWAQIQYKGAFPATPFGWYATPISHEQSLNMSMASVCDAETTEMRRFLRLALEEAARNPGFVPLANQNQAPLA